MNSQNNSFKLSEEEINSSVKAVANMRVFFGHQSVGKNILDGINDIAEGVDNKINIVESRVVNDKSEAAFYHAGVGKNNDPTLKINWPTNNPILTKKDSDSPNLDNLDNNFVLP